MRTEPKDRDRQVRQPDVSFLVSAYNVAPFIAEAVNAALAQTGVSVEVIVVDDCSTDATAAIVERIAATHPNVILARRAENGGLSVARNQAMDMASGRWLAILDGDDIVTPERSRHLINLGESLGADVVADNYERVDVAGRSLHTTMIPRSDPPHAFFLDMARFVSGNITFKKQNWTFGAIKPMIRADFMRARAIRYVEEPLLRNEDFILYAALIHAGGRFLVSSESHYKYRIRSGSNSWRLSAAHFDAMSRANKELALRQACRADAEALKAVAEYDRALALGTEFSHIVDLAKRGKWLPAAFDGLLRPALWPLLARFGTAAVVNRLRKSPAQ